MGDYGHVGILLNLLINALSTGGPNDPAAREVILRFRFRNFNELICRLGHKNSQMLL